ncbi:MAG TPA: mannose-6-phosphate isomerase, class I [Acidimicrobiales bacterium]|jgi:mannose-6-phosphate isomerase
MFLLDNAIQPYAWGPVDGVAHLVGGAGSGGPEAELWVGAHAGAPSHLSGGGVSLAEAIADDPAGLLGPAVVAAFGPRLPFLLKVLAIGSPLSLQAHPSADQAAAGFAREEAAGLALDASNRSYRDPWPKPEMLVALVDTWALCGFRDPSTAAVDLAALGVEGLVPMVEALAEGGAAGLEAAFGWLLHRRGPAGHRLAGEVAAAVAGVDTTVLEDRRGWVARLAETFPGDAGCVAPLLLNLVRLAPGEAVHLPAGNLHAYLQGAGVELMFASDNVLRGGLTPKPVDVDELLAVLHFEPGLPDPVVPRSAGPGRTDYDPGEASFVLSALVPDAAGGPIEVTSRGPSLLLATGGPGRVTGRDGEALVVDAGRAVFVAAGEPPVAVTAPAGTTVWWATVGSRPSG